MKKIIIIMALSLSAVFAVVSCNKSDSGSGTTTATTTTYQGAGSKWTIAMTGSDFVINKFATAGDSSPAIVINGTFIKYDTQFVKLTVTSATGSGAPSAGDVAYGLEVPGYAFFLKTAGAATEPIVMVQSGSCPTSGFNANWVIAKPKSSFTTLSSTTDYFGEATLTSASASSSMLVTQHQPITGAALTTGGGNSNGTSTLNFDLGNCSGGLLRVLDSGSYFDMYFTSSGGALVKFPDGQIIFASPKGSTAVTQSSLSGTYSAVVFMDKSAGDSVFPAKLTIPSSGNSTGTELSDIQLDTESTGGVVFSNISSNVDSTATALPAGFFRADVNLTSGATNGKVTCSLSTISSTKVIACSGYIYSTGTDANKPFFFLARSR